MDSKSFEILFRDHGLNNNKEFVIGVANLVDLIEDEAISKRSSRESVVELMMHLSDASTRYDVEIPRIDITLTPANYIALIASVADDTKLCKSLISNASDDDLIGPVVDAINRSVTFPAADHMVRGLLASGRDLEWAAVVDAAIAQFAHSYSRSTGVTARVLGALRVAEAYAQARLDEVVANGQALTRFSEAYSAKADADAAAIASLVLISEKPATLAAPDGASWTSVAEARPEFVSGVGTHLAAFGMRSLREVANIIKSAPKTATLIRESVDGLLRRNVLALPSPGEIATSYESVYLAVPEELDSVIVQEAAHSAEFWEALDASELVDTDVVLRTLLETDCEFTERAALFANLKLNEIAVDDWTGALDGADFPFALATETAKSIPQRPLGGHLPEALQRRFASLLKDDRKARSRWFNMLEFTSKNSQKTVLRSLRDYLATHSGCEAISDLLSAGDDALLTKGELDKAADGIARNLIIPSLSNETDWIWLQTAAEKLSSIVVGAEDETRGAILERLENRRRLPELRDAAEALRVAWDLPAFAVQLTDASTPDADTPSEEPD